MTDRPGGGATQQLGDLLPAELDRLPSWLPPVLAVLLDGCGDEPGTSPDWLRRITDRVRAADGAVPFAVVHDWQARTVVPMMLDAVRQSAGPVLAGTAESPAGTAESMAALRGLHADAAAGEPAGEPVWLAALEPALHGLYRLAYDYAGSYASAHASATAYARANDFSADGAVSFAESYAAHSAEANRQAFAESTAPATAAVLVAAYAQGDPAAAEAAYAQAYPFALLRACAQAVAGGAADEDQVRSRRQDAYLRLADGLADSLARPG